MAAEKYKICPNPKCGKHNKPKAIECAWCETDLSGVKPTDDETEAARVKAEAKKEEDKSNLEQRMAVPVNHAGKMIRICESCGAHNPANARKCVCGEDISDVIPVQEETDDPLPEKSCQEDPQFALTSVDGAYSFDIPVGITVVGRENEMKDYLAPKSFVSRMQAEIRNIDGKISVKNLSRTNFTYINNNRISDSAVELKEGDELGLGGNLRNGARQELAAYFVLKRK